MPRFLTMLVPVRRQLVDAGYQTTAVWQHRRACQVAQQDHSRPFHNTAHRLMATAQEESFPNHYAALQLPRMAAPTDIKSKYFELSKTHHPDRNPSDPSAASRFVRISTAYRVLINPTARVKYDRDYDRHFGSPNASQRSHDGSVGPAGGRPATGLSRRRTRQGAPPPSYFRNGSWTGRPMYQQSKRDSAHYDPVDDASRIHDEVPHFDQASHTRTQSVEDLRRRARYGGSPTGGTASPGSDEDFSDRGGTFIRFLLVGGVVGFSVTVPWLLSSDKARTEAAATSVSRRKPKPTPPVQSSEAD